MQYADAARPPGHCRICEDPRQYVGSAGQRWATLAELAAEGHHSELREEEPGLWGVGVDPPFAIGQRGLIVQTASGNVLWDVPGFIDADAVERVRRLGGLAAVSCSHPHFYGVAVEWSTAFGEVPVYLPASDRAWVCRPARCHRFYEDSVEPVPGIRLLRCGGHFPGSAVLHWPEGAGGRGALLTGDTITVVADHDWVSFMWSYPNLVPLAPTTVDRVVAAVAGLRFDRLYGGWWDRVVADGAKEKVLQSAARYRAMVEGEETGTAPEG